MPREFSRSDRVASQMQREIAELLRVQFVDPELGMVTLSDVEISRDLAVAKLYVSFLGAKIPENQCIKRLAERVPEMRHQLGRRIRIRQMPELKFIFDDSIGRGLRMDALLKDLSPSPERESSDEDLAGD